MKTGPDFTAGTAANFIRPCPARWACSQPPPSPINRIDFTMSVVPEPSTFVVGGISCSWLGRLSFWRPQPIIKTTADNKAYLARSTLNTAMGWRAVFFTSDRANFLHDECPRQLFGIGFTSSMQISFGRAKVCSRRSHVHCIANCGVFCSPRRAEVSHDPPVRY